MAMDLRTSPRRVPGTRHAAGKVLASCLAVVCAACAARLPADYGARLGSARGLVVVFRLIAPELPKDEKPADLERLSRSVGTMIRDELQQATGREVGLVVTGDETQWREARARRKDCLLLLCTGVTYPKSTTMGRAAHVAGNVLAVTGQVVVGLALSFLTGGDSVGSPELAFRKKEKLIMRLHDPRDDTALWSGSADYWKGSLRDPRTARPAIRAMLRVFAGKR